MLGKKLWLRPVIALLIVSLLPVANLAGFALQRAGAQVLEPIVLLEDYTDIYGNNVSMLFVAPDPDYVPVVNRLVFLGNGTTVQTGKYHFEYSSYYNWYTFDAWDLETGEHELYLDLIRNGQVEQTVSFSFTIPEKQSLTVYLFGPQSPIDLEFINIMTEEPEAPPTVTSGNGYWAYTIPAHPNQQFSLSADGYVLSSAANLISGSEQWEYVVHAVDTDFAVDLREFDIHFDADTGTVSGYLRFRGIGGSDNYRVSVTTDDGVYEACDVIDDDVEMGDTFVCMLQPGETPLKVRIDYMTENGLVPTNAAVNLEPVDLPEVHLIDDTDDKLGSAAPYMEFFGSQSSNIALYKIVPPVRDYQIEPDGVKYVPAAGGPSYSALLEAFDAYPGDRITIRMIDTNGHEFNDELVVPIVDSMASWREGLIRYVDYGCNNVMTLSYSSYYYCDYAEPYEQYLDHENAQYEDGAVTWTVPNAGAYLIAAYDLYFAKADDTGFTGIARVNIDPESETFSYPVDNIPFGVDRVAVVPLLVHSEFEGYPDAIVYYAEPFYIELPGHLIPQLPVLDPPMVNGEYAMQDENDPDGYQYLAIVDKDAETAAITVSSPNGEIWINDEVPLGSGGDYTVELDGYLTYVSIIVLSPADPDIFSIYVLTIYKGSDPVIELLANYVTGDSVYLYWDVYYLPDQQYQVDIDLFKIVDNEPVPVESYDIEPMPYLYYAKLSSLDPATYKVVVRLVHDGQEYASDEMMFEIPEPQPMHFYVFGPDEVLGNLQITGMSLDGSPTFETADWTYEEGNGYVRYTIQAKQGYCYSLNHETYRFNTPNPYAFCGGYSLSHVVHATLSAYDAHLDYVGMHSWLDGNLEGNIGFTKIGEYEDFELVTVDKNGAEHPCAVQETDWGGYSFQCPDYSEANSKFLRINAVVGQGTSIPTNAVVRIDAFDRFGDVLQFDENSHAGLLDLTVRFEANDETDVSLYQIEVPGSSVNGGNAILLEATGGDEPYVVHFGTFATHLGDQGVLHAYDANGYLYSDFKAVGIIDDMTEQGSWIDYGASCGWRTEICKPIEPYGEFAGHEDAAVVTEDDGTGNLSTFVKWTIPFSFERYPIAYDLYYAYPNKTIIRGEARVNLYVLNGEFRHPISQAPEHAAYIAVVPILNDIDDYFTLYHAEPFYVPLSATAEPDFIVSVEAMVRLEDGSYGYVPKGMTAGELMSRFNVVAGTNRQVLDKNDTPLASNDPVETGSKLVLSKENVTQTVILRFLYEVMGKSGNDPVTITDIALFIIMQLMSTDPKDLTGDEEFDRLDIRLLLNELNE